MYLAVWTLTVLLHHVQCAVAPKRLEIAINASTGGMLQKPKRVSKDDIQKNGIVFIRGTKVGGSTWVTVLTRLGKKTNLPWCGFQMSRKGSTCMRQFPKGFMFTVVRDPAERSLSQFYFDWGRSDLRKFQALSGEELEKQIVERFERSRLDKEVEYLSSRKGQTAQEVFDEYDFVAVTERFEESVLLLGKRLGVSMVDLLHFKEKESGAVAVSPHDYGKKMPYHVPLKQHSREARDAAKRLYDGPDGELYAKAQQHLDFHIIQYGKSWDQDLHKFKLMLQAVDRHCKQDHTHESDGATDCVDELVRLRGW